MCSSSFSQWAGEYHDDHFNWCVVVVNHIWAVAVTAFSLWVYWVSKAQKPNEWLHKAIKWSKAANAELLSPQSRDSLVFWLHVQNRNSDRSKGMRERGGGRLCPLILQFSKMLWTFVMCCYFSFQCGVENIRRAESLNGNPLFMKVPVTH